MDPKEFLDILKNRRSIRKFLEYDISDKELNMILEAGRWAPSGVNSQLWEVIVIKDKNKLKEIADLSKTLGTYNPEDLKNASCVLGIIKTNSEVRQYTNIGLFMQNIVLQAYVLGLGSCIIGSFDKEKVSKLLKIPKDKELCYIISIGKPDESLKKDRKNLSEFVFSEEYGVKIK
jgi:nitroreductase